VQHERHALGRLERLEHDEQRQSDRVGELHVVFRAPLMSSLRRRLRLVRVERLFAARVASAQHVEAHPADDRRQPAADVVDVVITGATHAQPGFLHGVVRFSGRSQHAGCNRLQVRAMCFESLSQQLAVVHRHTLGFQSVIGLTK